MKTLITGASGHVGSNLTRHLLEEGRDVRVLTHRTTGPSLEGLEVEVVQGDVRVPESLTQAMAGVETVFHLAACISITGGQGGKVKDINVTGARNVAEAALKAGVRKMVHCSSIHAFDLMRAPQPITEQSPRSEHPKNNAYDASKYQGELQVREMIAKGLDAVIVNPTGVIGPHDYYPSRMGQVFLDLYHRRMPAVVAGGFDWVDVRDIVQGLLGAERQGRTGENYILSGGFKSIRELSIEVEKTTGVKTPKLETPIGLARVGVPFARLWGSLTQSEPLFTQEALDALAPYPHVSHEKATAELDYQPRPLENTLRDLYDWLENQGSLAR
tara:strand:+ start:1875 stop:2861 length:987 start_codon:yes stop_codon:yes gene_type:complete